MSHYPEGTLSVERDPGASAGRWERSARSLCLIGGIVLLWTAMMAAPDRSLADVPHSPAPLASANARLAAASDAEGSPSASPAPSGIPRESPSESPQPQSPSPGPSASPKAGVTPAKKTYIGFKACLECHDEYSDVFHRTSHGKAASTLPDGPNQCEACHGPGSVHADDTDAASIVSFKRLNVIQANAICERCHAAMPGQYEWRMSPHAGAQVACTSCHEVHPKNKRDLQPRLLRYNTEKALCYTCHADVRAQANLPSHHPIEEDRLNCSDCHNVHGAQLSEFKHAPTARELCLKCHAQFRGPFAFEHEPVSDDCLNCHTPHGSAQSDLLLESEPFLCLRCHNTIHNPHVPPALEPAQQISNQALFFSRCTVCHSNIHGSDEPPDFTR